VDCGSRSTVSAQADSPQREKIDTTMISEHTRDGFSLSNPIADPDYYSVPKLLRRTADHLDELGDHVVTVRDLRLEWSEYRDPETHECNEKLWPTITVNWPDRRETTPPKPPNYFSTTTPEKESSRRSVPKLLLRMADHLDELGDDAVVFDLVAHTKPTGEGYAPSANTYYGREEGWVQNCNVPARDLLLEWERYADSQTHDPDEE
jgi:hypothetical protein